MYHKNDEELKRFDIEKFNTQIFTIKIPLEIIFHRKIKIVIEIRIYCGIRKATNRLTGSSNLLPQMSFLDRNKAQA